jgi:hypothetical protein
LETKKIQFIRLLSATSDMSFGALTSTSKWSPRMLSSRSLLEAALSALVLGIHSILWSDTQEDLEQLPLLDG